jgi:hypothetical protein
VFLSVDGLMLVVAAAASSVMAPLDVFSLGCCSLALLCPVPPLFRFSRPLVFAVWSGFSPCLVFAVWSGFSPCFLSLSLYLCASRCLSGVWAGSVRFLSVGLVFFFLRISCSCRVQSVRAFGLFRYCTPGLFSVLVYLFLFSLA